MAFNARNMVNFSLRMKNWVDNFNAQFHELEDIDRIYIDETASGSDPEFVDTENGTKQEHIDMIVFMRAMKDFRDGGVVSTLDRRSNLTPFLQ